MRTAWRHVLLLIALRTGLANTARLGPHCLHCAASLSMCCRPPQETAKQCPACGMAIEKVRAAWLYIPLSRHGVRALLDMMRALLWE